MSLFTKFCLLLLFFVNSLFINATPISTNSNNLSALKNIELNQKYNPTDSIPAKYKKPDYLVLNKIDSIIASSNKKSSGSKQLTKNKVDSKATEESLVSKYTDMAGEFIEDGVDYVSDGIEKAVVYNKEIVNKVIEEAKKFIGTPYKFGGDSKHGIDCSALIQKIFETNKLSIPRMSSSQAKLGVQVKKEELQQGDLVFFNTRGGISHVGIISEIINGIPYFIHSSSSKGVVQTSLESEYWAKRYVTARRLSQG